MDERTMCDGYPSPEDVEIVLEECPPPLFSAIAQALRDHKAGKVNGGLVIELDSSKGGIHDWKISRRMTQRIASFGRKGA